MILKESKSDIETFGGVREFRTGIDPKNLELITTLLSSNLYSDPVKSFIREIVSNAWDSHVEAGNTDQPVIINAVTTGPFNKYDRTYQTKVTVRDYGTGLSPERFRDIYCNIGSSTKRDTNEYIGGFGLGRFSALACSNLVYITSYYNGIAYYYVMTKDGNQIKLNLLREEPTTEGNGLEVTVDNIKNSELNDAVELVSFFPNIYFTGNALSNSYLNGIKIKRFTNFAVASVALPNRLLLGNVLYPLEDNRLSREASNFLNRLYHTGIVISMDVGEIDITPNRESIIYTQETVDKLERKVMEAAAEVNAIIKSKIQSNYDNMFEWYKMTSGYWYFDFFDMRIVSYRNNRSYIRVEQSDFANVTYRGKKHAGLSQLLGNIVNTVIPRFRFVCKDGKLFKSVKRYEVKKEAEFSTELRIVMLDVPRINNCMVEVIKENWDNCVFINRIDRTDIVAVATDLTRNLSSQDKDVMLQHIYEDFMERVTVLDIKNDPEYIIKRDEQAALREKNKQYHVSKECILHCLKEGVRCTQAFDSIDILVNYLKSYKQGILLTDTLANFDRWSVVASVRGLRYFQVKKSLLEEIKSMNLSFILDEEWALSEDTFVHRAAAAYKSGMNIITGWKFNMFLKTVPIDKAEYLLRLYDKYSVAVNSVNYSDILSGTEPDNPTLEDCERLMFMYSRFCEAYDLISNTMRCDPTLDIIVKVLMRRKNYIVRSNAALAANTNPLIKVLCR